MALKDAAQAKPRPKPSSGAPTLTTEAGIAAAQAAGVKITSPDRIAYPGQGLTKGELLAYYAAVAPVMLKHLADHPLSLVRCPQGRAKYCFFQKHDSGGFPEAVRKVPITEKDGTVEDYLYVDDLAGILASVQMNALEFHIWGSRRQAIEKPDRIVFDIDPDEGLGFAAVRQAALDMRDLLGALGLKAYPLVTGGKGVHVIAPLRPVRAWPEVKAFCKGFAMKLADAEPARFIATMSKARRQGKMFIDYLRNERGATAICPYSTRSREGAPVAVPVSWEELDGLERANGFGLAEAAARALGADPWPDYFKRRQTITASMLKAVGAA